MTREEQTLAFVAMLFPLVCCALLARQRPPGRAGVVLAAINALVAGVWDLHKAPYEGPAIVSFGPHNGLTVVDLVVPLSIAVSAAVLWRQSHAGRDAGPPR